MVEPIGEPKNLPRTELARLLAPGLWDRHDMAPPRDPSVIEEKKDALLAATTPDGMRVQLITTVIRSKDIQGLAIRVEPTSGTSRAHPDHPVVQARFEVSGATTVQEGLKQVLEKMRTAGYNPEVSGLDLWNT